MLALTRKVEYALIAMCHLTGKARDVLCSAREISDHHQLPVALLMNVLKDLSQAGLVRSVRGAAGGYALARPAIENTLSELIEAVEGPVKFVRCADADEPGHEPCDIAGSCIVRAPLIRVHERLKDYLSGISLAELANGGPAPLTQLHVQRIGPDEPTNLPR